MAAARGEVDGSYQLAACSDDDASLPILVTRVLFAFMSTWGGVLLGVMSVPDLR